MFIFSFVLMSYQKIQIGKNVNNTTSQIQLENILWNILNNWSLFSCNKQCIKQKFIINIIISEVIIILNTKERNFVKQAFWYEISTFNCYHCLYGMCHCNLFLFHLSIWNKFGSFVEKKIVFSKSNCLFSYKTKAVF